MVAAPLVEELVFRGFMAESYRRSGQRLAILLSAGAFSLAHLSLPQLRYYLLMGVALGVVYWRRGLVGSIATHAAFNGVLLAVALAAAHGPAVEHHVAGATIAIPGDVQRGHVALRQRRPGRQRPAGSDGRGGPRARCPGSWCRPTCWPKASPGRAFPLPDEIVIDGSSVSVFDLPAGRAVSMEAEIAGRDGRVIVLPQGSEAWLASYRSDGSAQSSEDFDDMVRSLTLPPATPPA